MLFKVYSVSLSERQASRQKYHILVSISVLVLVLVEVSTVRSCKMAIQAVSVAFTQLLWGMHSNVLLCCVI